MTFQPTDSSSGSQVAWAYPKTQGARWALSLVRTAFHHRARPFPRHTHTLSSGWDNIDTGVHLTSTSLRCGRKPKNPKKTGRGGENVQTPHRMVQLGINFFLINIIMQQHYLRTCCTLWLPVSHPSRYVYAWYSTFQYWLWNQPCDFHWLMGHWEAWCKQKAWQLSALASLRIEDHIYREIQSSQRFQIGESPGEPVTALHSIPVSDPRRLQQETP